MQVFILKSYLSQIHVKTIMKHHETARSRAGSSNEDRFESAVFRSA
jgi:hypothetical protein